MMCPDRVPSARRKSAYLGLLCALGWLATATPGFAQSSAIGHPTFLSPHASPIIESGGLIFAANTPDDTVDVFDAASRELVSRIDVGIDPVSITARPDGREIWVANHVSDSVSVIDAVPGSPTRLQVIDTIQDFMSETSRVTNFDEPVGIAFASDAKAYVALSTNNEVAVIDVATREVTGRLEIASQDPRAILVRGDRLFVLPFESNNQTQVSGCVRDAMGNLPFPCTHDAVPVAQRNNVNLQGIQTDIITEPRVADRDLYVFDTRTDQLVETIDTIGTLLYDMAATSDGSRVFVAQTDARNDANGRAGSRGDGLAELENRAFLNQITRVDCGADGCGAPSFIDLEPPPPAQPAPGAALATPYGIEITPDDQMLVVTAAGSGVVFTVDAASGEVLGRARVEAVPRGIALLSDEGGAAREAWVLNAASNSISVVALSDPSSPVVTTTIALDDPTDPVMKAGRIAFNDADASTTGTFSCESCHPDGNTDQLIWILETAPCGGFLVTGCDQTPPRLTMPIRGLRDTEPFLWSGEAGDPFGGRNVSNITGNEEPNCALDDDESCTRFVVDAVAATTLCLEGECPTNDEGHPGALDRVERDAMARFMLGVPYPPAQRRAYDNVPSSGAFEGFRLFHITGAQRGGVADLCGNCHRMPFWVSTNTVGTGMEAPTWRGAYDRWGILPNKRGQIVDFEFFADLLDEGLPELGVWRQTWSFLERFDPVWNMVLEGSTGFSGAFARQATLNQRTAGEPRTADLLGALEQSAREGAIVLQAEGVFLGESTREVALEFRDGAYLDRTGSAEPMTRDVLVELAAAGGFVGTFTGRLGVNVDVNTPQPALWTLGPIERQGRQVFPRVSADSPTMRMSSRHIEPGATLYVDGRRVPGRVTCRSGTFPTCSGNGDIAVALESLPAEGMHLLQVQNPEGLFSNDFIFFRD